MKLNNYLLTLAMAATLATTSVAAATKQPTNNGNITVPTDPPPEACLCPVNLPSILPDWCQRRWIKLPKECRTNNGKSPKK